MKSLKRALAAFLAVLMVAFSVPFTASAATSSQAPNVHLAVYDYVITDGQLYWGPQDEASAQEYALTDSLTANQYYAVAFMVTGMNNFRTIQLDGSYDLNKITPTNVTVSRGKPKVTVDAFGSTVDGQPSFIAHMGSSSVKVQDTTNNAISEAGSCMTDDSLLGYNRMYLANLATQGADFTGKTYIVDGWDGSDYNGCYIDGTLLKVCIITVKENMTVADLYNAFDFSIAEDQKGVDNTGAAFSAVTFGPKGGNTPTPSEDVYTYTFADGTTQEVKVAAGETPTAPANTAATAWAHVADTETHARTTYAWAADGDKAFKEVGTADSAACAFSTKTAAVAPIHTKDQLVDGKTAVEACTVCGFEKGGEAVPAAHAYTTSEVAATCQTKAHTHYACACGAEYDDNFTGELAEHTWVQTGTTGADCQTPGTVSYECSVCGATKTEEGALGDHTWREDAEVPATCETAGVAAGKTCTICGTTEGYDVIPVKGHTAGEDVVTEVPATCTTDGSKTTVANCTVCGKEVKNVVETIPATGHAWVEDAEVPATCETAGVAAGKTCSVCDTTEGYDVIPATGHTWREDAEVPATRAEAGTAAGKTCTVCGKTEGYEVIPALGVDITIAVSSLGSAAVNGETVSGVKNVPYGAAYTLTATPADGAKFAGWMVNNKLVSEEATYTTSAYADMTYVPVFVEADADVFTITFVDTYGNVAATVSSADLPLAELPAAPQFAGLTFTGWSKTLEEVNALTASEKIVASYENDESKTFTVTAQDGATIIVDGKDCGTSTEVTYNTLVTVKADGATSWTANGTVAAYGSEYAFFCGSDITVGFDSAAVDATATVAKVSVDKGADHKVKFLATRSIPADVQLIESGFVYGKAMTEDDLKLENVGKAVNGAAVKQIVCNNKGVDGQFALTYGIKAMNANATASAYIIYKQGGETKVAYAYMSFDYNA